MLTVLALSATLGATLYAARWRYVTTPGELTLRVNRWTDRTEVFTIKGWRAVTNDPFAEIGDRQP